MVEEIKDLHGKKAVNKELLDIAPWAKGDHLRKIESEVLIPNLMKKKAKVLCKDVMASFAECVKGRTISMAWSCGKETKAMKSCLKEMLAKPELYEEARVEYLTTRNSFQEHYAATGVKKKQQKKESVVY
ncbi:COX assembly mitochondrial protein homolog [Hydractinia symbiolongicarpus]|uniref:COX assembly mitochondrial protein homolog n=1 Tax=Hydractinia symbiolongicarpus TaxID=13093 RepID=UPI00255138F8|nr:COX assembly mitochondrial protein homolog [Hydractinia symbiolongicarpus]XP_057310108.1 COX assembly mitochondrial protein homolog [Hydractinia symbiolongicarpus]